MISGSGPTCLAISNDDNFSKRIDISKQKMLGS